MNVVLKAGKLIDGTGNSPIRNAAVVIEDNRVKAVGEAAKLKLPADAQVVDLPGCTLMPGLADLHMHVAAPNLRSYKHYRVAVTEVSPELQLLYAARHARMMLQAGFTLVRDCGWPTMLGGQVTRGMVALRDAIDTGFMPGPRLIVGGTTVINNSHLDIILPRNCYRDPSTLADGPWEMRKLARINLRWGVDYLKTWASGGAGTMGDRITDKNITQEELDAVVDEGHSVGKFTACHCHTPDAVRMALKAGVDTIEHIVYTDDDAIRRLKEAGKYVIPTLTKRSLKAIQARITVGASDEVTEKKLKTREICTESFKRMHQAGIKIACGTDLSVDPGMGENALELELYVEFGMTPMEAIMTATRNAAEAVGRLNDLGTIEPGKLADMIAVDGDPLHDIRVLQQHDKIKVVMKNGLVVVDRRDGERVLHETPTVKLWY
jgi:imidazolonepropionase-like amidohydrolase